MKKITNSVLPNNIRYLREKEDLSQEGFGKLFGCTRDNIASYERGTLPPIDIVVKIVKHFHTTVEDIITTDLSKGKKEVIALGNKVPMRLNSEDFEDAFPDWRGLPVFNQPISASFVEHYNDESTYEPIYHLRDPRFKDCDFAAIITGDSMHDEIRHGDYVVCQEIKDRSFIVFGDIYYVVATNGLQTCKYVNAHAKKDDIIMLMPKNKNISPSPLNKSMIQNLYKVKGIIRGY